MSQRPHLRKSNNNEQHIQESCRGNNEMSRISEEENDDNECSERYSRYDPKELRDAARILGPFLRLSDEVNNPYARIVARELCDTFHGLFYPDKHPLDVMKSFNSLTKSQKSIQMWNEFWLYTPDTRYKEWVPLCKEPLIEIEDECDPCRPKDKPDCGPADQQQFPDSENFIRRQTKSKNRNGKPTHNCDAKEPRTPPRQSPECVDYYDTCGSDTYENLCDISPPDDIFDDSYPNLCDVSPPADMCEHQLAAGCDSSPVSKSSKPIVGKTTYSPIRSGGNQKYRSRLDSECVWDGANDSSEERHTFYDATSEDAIIDESETDISTSLRATPNRQHAGNDVYLPYCKPGCSTDPDYMMSDYVQNPAQFEYYRVTGSSPSSRRNENDRNGLQAIPLSPIEPELRTNALDDTIDGGCDDSDSADSVVSVDQIACNVKMFASAFTNLSLAQKELNKKKSAFKTLTKNYLNYASNPIEADPPCAGTTSTKKMLKTIYKNPPNVLMPFDDSEWNDNCFRDKDFVRLLPFYEIVHNQLEYISKTQREYGVNMLDDIVSVFHHIHYDLGDPRLKNEMLIEHVKLVTKNTWESYFYPGDEKMPPIPEKPDVFFQSSPLQRSMSQHLSPIQLSPRQASPKPPNQVPPALRQISPKPPTQEAPPSSSVKSKPPRKDQKTRPSTAANRKPRETSRVRASDVPQQADPPVPIKKNFLRRSQPSGAPKGWVPKIKAVERPKEAKTFKAKPLPKFVRDRLNNQDKNC